MSTTYATYRCDRCGVKQEHDRRHDYSPPGWDNASIPGRAKYTSKYVDLCPQCTGEINDWLDNPSARNLEEALTPTVCQGGADGVGGYVLLHGSKRITRPWLLILLLVVPALIAALAAGFWCVR